MSRLEGRLGEDETGEPGLPILDMIMSREEE
jgi:hypothetical protein